MGVCALVCVSERTANLRDLEDTKTTDKGLGRNSPENDSKAMGKLHDQNSIPPSRPRTPSLSSISAIHVSRVPNITTFARNGDDKKVVLQELPPKPPRRKACQGLRVIIPEKMEKRSPTTQSAKEYTETINSSLAKFTLL